MRVGLFGGSFDPPHIGHVAAARAAADAFGLERVLFAPVGRQPLKRDGLSASYADRMAMVGLACAENGRFEASAVDAPRADGAPNYTVDTLARLRGEFAGAELYGLVGLDAYREMNRWREPERLLALAEWIVVTRPGYEAEGVGERAHLLATVHVDVSATALRERLRLGLDCSGAIPSAVLAYIAERGLYRG